MSDSARPHRRQPTRLPRPWDSPGKNTGVGCHFLLQCIKVKLKWSRSVMSNSMDCSTPGFPVHYQLLESTQNHVHHVSDAHPMILSSVIPFSSHFQSFPAPGSFPMSQFFTSGGQSIGASASVLPMNIQGWSPLGWTSLIFLQSRGFPTVFSNTTVQKHQFFSAPLSL